jgi:hypothetical protein
VASVVIFGFGFYWFFLILIILNIPIMPNITFLCVFLLCLGVNLGGLCKYFGFF